MAAIQPPLFALEFQCLLASSPQVHTQQQYAQIIGLYTNQFPPKRCQTGG